MIDDYDDDGYTWEWSASGNEIGWGSAAGYMGCSSDGAAAALDERLETGEYDRGGCDTVTLIFNHLYDHNDGDYAQIEIDVDDGGWEVVTTYDADDNNEVQIDLTSYLDTGSAFRLGFVYSAYQDLDWAVDDVKVIGNY